MTPASTRFPLRKSPRRLAEEMRYGAITGDCLCGNIHRGVGPPIPGGPLPLPRLPQASRGPAPRLGDIAPGGGDGHGRDSRLRRAVLLSRLRLVRLCAHRGRNQVSLGTLDAPDQLIPTYKLWTIRRESSLPTLPLTQHYAHNRNASGTRGVARHHRAGAVVRTPRNRACTPCRLCDSRLARPSHFVRCETTNLARFLKNSF